MGHSGFGVCVSLLDSRVRIQHPCPFCELSADFPDAEMATWCNRSYDIIQVSVRDPGQLPDLLSKAKKRLHVREMFQDGRSALVMTRNCACYDYRSISSIADETGVWTVPPITYLEGWETHRLISSSASDVQRFFAEVRKVGKIEVQSYKPRERLSFIQDFGVPVHLFEGLTDRQIRSLVAAYENGLLEVPSRGRMDRVARRERLSRSTFGEHLRKAQQQLIRNAYPWLKFRDSTAAPGRSSVR